MVWINEEVEGEIGAKIYYTTKEVKKIEISQEVKDLIKKFLTEENIICEYTRYSCIDDYGLFSIYIPKIREEIQVFKSSVNFFVKDKYVNYLYELKFKIRDFNQKYYNPTILLKKRDKLIDIVNQKIILEYKTKNPLSIGEIGNNFILADVYIHLKNRKEIPISDWYKPVVRYNAIIEPVNLQEFKDLLEGKFIEIDIKKEGKYFKGQVIYKYKKNKLLTELVNCVTCNIIGVDDISPLINKITNAKKYTQILHNYNQKLKNMLNFENSKCYVFSCGRKETLKELLNNNTNFIIGYNKKWNEIELYKITPYGLIVA